MRLRLNASKKRNLVKSKFIPAGLLCSSAGGSCTLRKYARWSACSDARAPCVVLPLGRMWSKGHKRQPRNRLVATGYSWNTDSTNLTRIDTNQTLFDRKLCVHPCQIRRICVPIYFIATSLIKPHPTKSSAMGDDKRYRVSNGSIQRPKT